MTLKNRNRSIGFIFFAMVIGFSSCQDRTKEKKPITSEKKNAITDVVLTDLNNQPINLEQLKGKTVFINFWATWCKPCIQEMPSIKSAQDILIKKGVVFLFASNETQDQIIEFKNDHSYDFNYVRIVNMEELNIDALPTTYIFNPKGELVYSEIGFRKWDSPTNIEMISKINDQK